VIRVRWECVNCDCVCVFTVRLVDGPNLREGRLEVLRNGVWGGVCYEYTRDRPAVDDDAARVICSMLGYGYADAFDCFSMFVLILILLLIQLCIH